MSDQVVMKKGRSLSLRNCYSSLVSQGSSVLLFCGDKCLVIWICTTMLLYLFQRCVGDTWASDPFILQCGMDGVTALFTFNGLWFNGLPAASSDFLKNTIRNKNPRDFQNSARVDAPLVNTGLSKGFRRMVFQQVVLKGKLVCGPRVIVVAEAQLLAPCRSFIRRFQRPVNKRASLMPKLMFIARLHCRMTVPHILRAGRNETF